MLARQDRWKQADRLHLYGGVLLHSGRTDSPGPGTYITSDLAVSQTAEAKSLRRSLQKSRRRPPRHVAERRAAVWCTDPRCVCRRGAAAFGSGTRRGYDPMSAAAQSDAARMPGSACTGHGILGCGATTLTVLSARHYVCVCACVCRPGCILRRKGDAVGNQVVQQRLLRGAASWSDQLAACSCRTSVVNSRECAWNGPCPPRGSDHASVVHEVPGACATHVLPSSAGQQRRGVGVHGVGRWSGASEAQVDNASAGRGSKHNRRGELLRKCVELARACACPLWASQAGVVRLCGCRICNVHVGARAGKQLW